MAIRVKLDHLLLDRRMTLTELAERVGMYLEAYGFAAAGREDPAYLNGGVTLLLSPELQLDLRVGARTDRGNERFFGVGLAHRW